MLGWQELVTLGSGVASIVDDETKRRYWRKFLSLVKDEKKILILGNSGSGKTQFLESLKKSFPTDAPRPTVKHKPASFSLGGTSFILIDSPGHLDYKSHRNSMLKELLRGEIEGVINVTSYGYDESRIGGSAVPSERFLKHNRKLEIERLCEWLPLVEGSGLNWVITLCNKADLWWDNMNDVHNHYASGDYKKQIRKFISPHEIKVHECPYCSIIQPFNGFGSNNFGELEKNRLNSYLPNIMSDLI